MWQCRCATENLHPAEVRLCERCNTIAPPDLVPAPALDAHDAAEAGDVEDEQSLVARPSDIRALRRQLIEQERQELGLPEPPEPEPRTRQEAWMRAIAIAAIALLVVAALVTFVRSH